MTKRNRLRKGAASLPKAAVTLTQWDMGATGPANRARLVVESAGDIDPETGKEINPNGIKRARVVDILETWRKSGAIDTAQWNTAVVLRAAWERTEQAPGTDYAAPRVDSSPKPDHAISIQIDRISALNAAWARVHGDDREFLYHCVVRGLIVATYRHQGKRPYHGAGYAAGMQALRDALNRAGTTKGLDDKS